MPTLFCCILNCESESVTSKKRKIFYRLPQNSDRKQLWLNHIGDRIKYGTISSNSRICNAHFATGKPNLDSSHVDHVPTLFPWSSKEERARTYQMVEIYDTKIKELEQKILTKAFLNASTDSKMSSKSEITRLEVTNDCPKLNLELEAEKKTNIKKINLKLEASTARIRPAISHPIVTVSSQSSSMDLGNAVAVNGNLLNYLINSLSHVNGPSKVEHVITSLPISVNIARPQSPLNLSHGYNLHVDGKHLDHQRTSFEGSRSGCQITSMLDGSVPGYQRTPIIDCPLSASQKTSIIQSPLSLSHKSMTTVFEGSPSSFTKVLSTSQSKHDTIVEGPTSTYENMHPFILKASDKLLSSSISQLAPIPPLTEDSNSRSCTCTKSSCLKLYCECFATGNLCSSGCTCNNCRNNNEHKEERAKIVSSYLERDPWVFNSKIENQDDSKKHSKGCNCLKSSCLKNYCECFENKVFCSSLCRCRMCYNNEDHTHQNHRDDVKIYPASHTSDSLSILSENSPKDFRKRKRSNVKSNEVYEDVSSNESALELNAKRRQLDPDSGSLDNEVVSTRSITSMDIPPVLPQEDDFTEEELAMMLRFKEQRSMKVEEVLHPTVSQASSYSPQRVHLYSPSTLPRVHQASPCPPLRAHRASPCPPAVMQPDSPCPPLNLVCAPQSNGIGHDTLVTTTVPSIPSTQIENNLLLSLSKSLAVANLGLGGGLSLVSSPVQEVPQISGTDLLNLLVSQQLMAPRPTTVSTNYSHVIPVNLSQISQQLNCCIPQTNGHFTAIVTSSKAPLTSVGSSVITYSHSKTKLSTEDYVRRHIEAAEKAVRADNMRRDCVGPKKAISRQRTKTDASSSPPKVSPTGVSEPPPVRHGADDYPNGGALPLRLVSTSAPSHPMKGVAISDMPIGGSLSSVNPRRTHSYSEDGGDLSPLRRSSYNGRWKHKYNNLRKSLHNMRTELRSIKVHMRADQSKIRRLESTLLYMSKELYK